MFIPLQEIERWHHELELTLMHEHFEQKWHLANMTPPPNELDAVLSNPLLCGSGLLELLQRRTQILGEKLLSLHFPDKDKQYLHERRLKSLLRVHQNAQKAYLLMGEVKAEIDQIELSLLHNTLGEEATLEEKSARFAQSRLQLQALLNQIIARTFEATYLATAYDFNIQNSFHVEQSFNVHATRPKKAGEAKSQKYQPVRTIVQSMGLHLITHFSHGTLKKKDIEEAIAKHLEAYVKKHSDRKDPAFIYFAARCPSLKTIKNWLVEIKTPTATDDASEINIQQLLQQLKTAYPAKAIREQLK
ncbi:Uncharacterised protein [Plesiomonas shigelloides]|uniref:hypothetical protein n=1 Tax=Plesiomonas shigelloides TaxID=703 RepID=UPI0007EE0A36|nr:hypothetical protein [Plesiomonas shigelloides]SBT59831.1 Uncharacterised protein [Plesiomonas shigelloides]